MSDERRPGRRSTLRAEDILIAAVALVDTEGISQLTMRRLGTAIGVEAMTLYRYFPSRRNLLDALVESVVGEVATDPGLQMLPDDDWRDYLDRHHQTPTHHDLHSGQTFRLEFRTDPETDPPVSPRSADRSTRQPPRRSPGVRCALAIRRAHLMARIAADTCRAHGA